MIQCGGGDWGTDISMHMLEEWGRPGRKGIGGTQQEGRVKKGLSLRKWGENCGGKYRPCGPKKGKGVRYSKGKHVAGRPGEHKKKKKKVRVLGGGSK